MQIFSSHNLKQCGYTYCSCYRGQQRPPRSSRQRYHHGGYFLIVESHHPSLLLLCLHDPASCFFHNRRPLGQARRSFLVTFDSVLACSLTPHYLPVWLLAWFTFVLAATFHSLLVLSNGASLLANGRFPCQYKSAYEQYPTPLQHLSEKALIQRRISSPYSHCQQGSPLDLL